MAPTMINTRKPANSQRRKHAQRTPNRNFSLLVHPGLSDEHIKRKGKRSVETTASLPPPDLPIKSFPRSPTPKSMNNLLDCDHIDDGHALTLDKSPLPSLLRHTWRHAPSFMLESVPSLAFIQLRRQPSSHLFCKRCSCQCLLVIPWPRRALPHFCLYPSEQPREPSPSSS
jgi:hypothetical protein